MKSFESQGVGIPDKGGAFSVEEPEINDPEKEQRIDYLDTVIAGRPVSKLTPSERTRVYVRESDIKEKTRYLEIFETFLARYGVAVDLEHIGDRLFAVDVKQADISGLLPELPDGYAFIGGAARAVLGRVIGLGYGMEPRDLDIVRITNDSALDTEIAQRYMPDDYAHGHGVRQIREDYFDSRDLTMNEVLYYQDKLFLTKDCLLDTVRGIIRFSDFERKESWDEGKPYWINDKLLAKALRFAAELTERGLEVEVEEDPYKFEYINDFHMALHLDRALERGYSTAQAYVDKLIEKGQLEENVNTPEALQAHLEDQIYSFSFRFCATSQYLAEHRLLGGNDFDEDVLTDMYEHKIDLVEKYKILPFREKM